MVALGAGQRRGRLFSDAEDEERAPANPPALAGQVKNALAEIAPDLVLYSVEPYPEVIRSGSRKKTWSLV